MSDPARDRPGRGLWPSAAWLAATAALFAGCPRFQQRAIPLSGSADRYVALGRERIFLRQMGRGPAVLLIHGYGGTHDSWLPVARELARNHRVLLVDLPGFGRSDKYRGDYSPGGLARTLRALLDRLDVDRVHLVAHSWGGSIALAAALQQPARVASLTLVSPWVFEEQLAPFIKWARVPGLGEALFTLFYDERLDDRLALTFYDPGPYLAPDLIERSRAALRRPGARAAALAAARGMRLLAQQQRYHSIAAPTLLVGCHEDPISWPRFLHRLHRTLPRAELLLLAQCAHMPQLERPHAVARRLLRHLATQTPQAAGGASPGVERGAAR